MSVDTLQQHVEPSFEVGPHVRRLAWLALRSSGTSRTMPSAAAAIPSSISRRRRSADARADRRGEFSTGERSVSRRPRRARASPPAGQHQAHTGGSGLARHTRRDGHRRSARGPRGAVAAGHLRPDVCRRGAHRHPQRLGVPGRRPRAEAQARRALRLPRLLHRRTAAAVLRGRTGAQRPHGAPHSTVGVVPLTREPDGRLALGGTGPPVEWLLEMTRFDGEALCDRLAARGALRLPSMQTLGAGGGGHARARRRVPGHGGAAAHALGHRRQSPTAFDELRPTALLPAGDASTPDGADARAAARRWPPRLDARAHDGFVRQCHGDLHLRNIVLLDGRRRRSMPWSSTTTSPASTSGYDVAFLLMDLWHRDLPRHAQRGAERVRARTPATSTAWRCCRSSSPAARPCAPRRAPRRRRCAGDARGARRRSSTPRAAT